VPADPDVLFATAVEDRYQAAATLLGVDLTLLSNAPGHA
jgi:putative transcriptional regulator